MIGVLVSLVGLMSRAVRPRTIWLGKDSSSGLFRRREEGGVDAIHDISIVHFGAELFFANVGSFRDSVLTEVDERHPRAVVIDAEAITDVDTTAADEIVKLADKLALQDVTLVYARLQDPAKSALESGGLDMSDRDIGRVERAIEALTDPNM